MLAIIDYGRGNLFSLQSALKYLGSNFKIVANAEELNSSYDKIILPGVGAFGDAIAQLKYKNFISKLNNAYERKVPILGICLGMQLFASRSFEFLTTEGFNFIPGEVKKLKSLLLQRSEQLKAVLRLRWTKAWLGSLGMRL